MNKLQTVNTFGEGLIMDLDPIKATNNSLTSALNATILTFNSNENSLLCDMGNGRVESAYLPEGYMPLGTTSFGGVIYIVSYNPENNRCQIGSFPSPERNFTKDEVGESIVIDNNSFLDANSNIINTLVKKKLSNIQLNPGDKYIVYGSQREECFEVDLNGTPLSYLDIKFATINSSGLLVYLGTLQVYDKDKDGKWSPIKIKPNSESDSESDTVDTYRELIDADYNIFDALSAGNLYIIFKLNVPTEFTVTYDIGRPYLKDERSYIPVIFYYEILPKEYSHLEYILIQASNTENEHTPKLLKGSITLDILEGEAASFTFTPILEFGIYDKLAKTIKIDTSLINSGTVVSNEWRYYKNSTGMLIDFEVNNFMYFGEYVKGCKLIFTPADKCTLDMQLSKLYDSEFTSFECSPNSGKFSIEMPFNDSFEANKLYLAAIIYQIQSYEKIEYRGAYHWIYTNGIFNQDYIVQGQSNFDNLTLPIEYSLTFNVGKPVISSSSETNDKTKIYLSPYVSEEETNKKIDYTELISTTLDLNVLICIKNSYNIFEIDLQIKGEMGEVTSEVSCTTNKNGEILIDNDTISLPTVTKPVSTTINDKVTLSMTLEDSIYFNTAYKTVTVGKYYAPVLETLEDYSKYGLIFDKSTFYNDTTFAALGMSAGGDDSLGGGGLKNRKGMVTLGTTDKGDDTAIILLNLSEVVENSPNDDSGYSKLPNSKLSTFIASNTDSAPIVPILLTWIGGTSIVSGPTGELKELRYTEQGDGGKDTNRTNNFKSELPSTYRYLWLFIKATNGTTYLPVNDFIKITGDSSDNGTYFETCLYKYASILALLYVEKSSTHNTAQAYIVDKFDYNTNIEINIKANMTFGQSSIIPNVKVQNTELSKLLNIYNAECIKIPECSLGTSTIEVKIPIENPLLATFEKLTSDTPYLSYYIYYPIKNEKLSYLSFEDDLGIVYTLGTSSLNTGIRKLNNIELVAGSIKYTLENDIYLLDIKNIRNVLSYNNRTDELGIDYGKYLRLEGLTLMFSDAKGGYKSNTEVSKYSILSSNSFNDVSTTKQ